MSSIPLWKTKALDSRDLALLLPDIVDNAQVYRTSNATLDVELPVFKPKYEKKVQRYFPNQAPKWMQDKGDEENIEEVSQQSQAHTITQSEPITIDRRLARLSKISKTNSNNNDNNNDNINTGRRQRKVYQAEIVEETKIEPITDSNDKDGSNSVSIRHGTIKVVDILAKTNRDPLPPAKPYLKKTSDEYSESETKSESLEESEDSFSSSDEEDEEDEEEIRNIIRPIFVPKHLRETIKEKERKEAEEALRLAQQTIFNEEKKQKLRIQVAESIRKLDEKDAMNAETDKDSDIERPDDTDDLDDPLEFANWKIREINRLKRDSMQRQEYELEKKEVERRRNMTEEERLEEDRKLKIGIFKDQKPKEKLQFLQKYYHKGVFYMDDDTLKKDSNDARLKDYNAPTFEDKVNREALPKILQVKNFGKRSRTKYTHLVDQDTTDHSYKYLVEKSIQDKYMHKRAGVGDLNYQSHKKLKN